MDVPEDPSQLDPVKMRNYISQARTKERNTRLGSKDQPIKFIEEDNINEMSRPAVVFKVAEDFKEKAKDFNSNLTSTSKRNRYIVAELDLSGRFEQL